MQYLDTILGRPSDEPDQDYTSPRKLEQMHELPVFGVPPPDRKWLIDMIVRELDNGQFTNAGKLGDAILRDGRIMGAMEQRLAALFGAPFELEAADETAKAVQYRDELDNQWSEMFPRDVLEEMHQYAILNGIAIAEKVWNTSKKPWTFTLNVFHPQFYVWRWDTRSYHVITYDRGLVRVPRRSTQWIVYTPYGYKRAFLRGRLRSLVDPWLFRGWDKNDWASWCEVHGNPIRKAIVPQQADPKHEKEFVNAIANLGSKTVIKTRQDADGNKFDVELVEAMSMGWKGFEAAMAWCSKEISLVLLGQAMSTDGVGGLNSQEEPGKGVRGDIKEADSAKLCEMLYDQGLREYCEFNYGNPDLAPIPKYMVEPPEDSAAIAKMHLDQANADAVYIDRGVFTPEEVAISRVGGGEYSLETEIDVDARKRIQDASMKELEQQAQNDLEAANDPKTTPGAAEQQAMDTQQALPGMPPGAPKAKRGRKPKQPE